MDKKMSQDWPYLNRYKKENAFLESPKLVENRIVFMGDSITEFWSELHSDFFIGKTYINRGISGQLVRKCLLVSGQMLLT